MPRFSEKLLEYAQEPPNHGALPEATAIGTANLDGQPPWITILLVVDDERILAAHFEASGCGVSIAAAAALTELLIGRLRTECRLIEPYDIARALDGIPNDKMYCAYVAVAALRNALFH